MLAPAYLLISRSGRGECIWVKGGRVAYIAGFGFGLGGGTPPSDPFIDRSVGLV